MTDHVPTTGEVRAAIATSYDRAICAGEIPAQEKANGLAAFQRWLTSIQAEARAAALRGAADAFDVLDTEALHDEDAHTAATGIMDDPSGWLRALANQQETNDELLHHTDD